jgi:fused signal recognition particle receptor
MFDLKSKLQKTRDHLVSPLKKVFGGDRPLSADEQDEVEALLLGSDMGIDACERIMEALRTRREPLDYKTFLKNEFMELLSEAPEPKTGTPAGPRALLIVGVNGVGKTTSIAKLAHYLGNRGKKVILAAGDTFRAAAREQLSRWAERLDVQMVAHQDGGDPAAVAYDACNAARTRGADVVIIDTAGRLHTRVNLMEELNKIKRVCCKVLGPDAVETYLTLDATLGQNSLNQAQEFTRNLNTRGIILTKLDSTAKGGIVIAIRQSLGIPVRFIAAGEALDDFSEFSASEFIDALLA